MNRNASSSSSSSPSGSSASSSSFNDSIHALASIVPLRTVRENESPQINDIPFVLSEKEVDRFCDQYHIYREIFHIFTPSLSIHVDDQIAMKDTIMMYEEKLKAGLQYPMDPFFNEVLLLHKLSVAQLHPKAGGSWWPSGSFI